MQSTTIKRCSKPCHDAAYRLSTTRRAAARAFTLVELLVTIATIALLLSMLMPSLHRARQNGTVVACRSRLRNVCIGALMYAADHQGALPVDSMLGPPYADVSNPHTPLFDALAGYVQDDENYYCPAETDPKLMYSKENFQTGAMGYYYYSCLRPTGNRDISTFLRWDVDWPRRLRDTMHPRTWVISDSWFRARPTAHPQFRKGVNYATLDASVQMLYDSPRRQFR